VAAQGSLGPRTIYAPEPEYTEEARQARREGVCVLSFIVGLDGKPSHIVVAKKLGMGLDQKAIEAVTKSRFEPARQYGRPVMMRLNLSVSFKLFGLGSVNIVELTQRANNGDAAAEFELANAFFEGRDIPKDEDQGAAMLERAARDGAAKAQFQMGARAYGAGDSPDNYVAAYMWYALAQRGGVEGSDKMVSELEAKMLPVKLQRHLQFPRRVAGVEDLAEVGVLVADAQTRVDVGRIGATELWMIEGVEALETIFKRVPSRSLPRPNSLNIERSALSRRGCALCPGLRGAVPIVVVRLRQEVAAVRC
jgi:TonB family protein